MKNKTTKQSCAGNGAGNSSNDGLKTPKFQRVKDSKGKPIRGLWIRGKQFYARLFIDDGSGQKIDRRVPLEMTTVQEARRELEQLKYLGKSSSLSIRQSQPFNSFRDHYLYSIANMKRKRTYDSENQHLKQWSAFFGNLPIHQISREKIIKYRTAKIKGGWTGRTVNLSITILNNLLNHAKDNGLINTLPTEGLKPIRWKPKKRPLFAPEQIDGIWPCRTPKLQTRAASGRLLAPHEDLWFPGHRNAPSPVVRRRLGQEATDHRFRWPHQKP